MRGYAGNILLCDLSSRNFKLLSTQDYTRDFIGGRGLGLCLYWQFADFSITAFDPGNPLIITTGPFCGFPGLAGSRWEICAKSPNTNLNRFSYGNLGGNWGLSLKRAGIDALVITGNADSLVYLEIEEQKCHFHSADHLQQLAAPSAAKVLSSEVGNNCHALVNGPSGENLVPFSNIITDDGASCSCGFGAVMGAKRLKGIVVHGSRRFSAADPEQLRHLSGVLKEIKRQEMIEFPLVPEGLTSRRLTCPDCITGCGRTLFSGHGKRGKYLCTSGFFYEDHAKRYYGESNEIPFLATRLCDEYALDANMISTMTDWLYRCYINGVITTKDIGLPLSSIGSYEFIEQLVTQIALQQGAGVTLSQGTVATAKAYGPEAEKQLPEYVYSDSSYTGYCAQAYVTNAMIFATEPRQPYPAVGEVGRTVIGWLSGFDDVSGGKTERMPVGGNQINNADLRNIARIFWGSEEAADLSNTKGKALAAKLIQDRHCVKASAVLCNFAWHVSSIERFRPEIIAEILNAITGTEYDLADLFKVGERIFNLQRSIIVRERGMGREGDRLPDHWFTVPVEEAFLNPEVIIPGIDGKPQSKRHTILSHDDFSSIKDEYYDLRGWDIDTGLQFSRKLTGLGLKEVAGELQNHDLVK